MIETKRLILRNWQESDYEPLAKINADPEVMRYFPRLFTSEDTERMIEKCLQIFSANGYSFCAVELQTTGELIGMAGIVPCDEKEIPHTPFTEIGWRFAKEYWRQGYAYEAANAWLDYGFNTLSLDEIYAFTAVGNEPSWRLMEKLGMHNTHQDFNHPKVEKGNRLERDYLYKIKKDIYF